MAETPKKDRTGRSPRQPEEKSEQQRREASGRAEELDPREEEGWSQPESSAQKGADSNDGEED